MGPEWLDGGSVKPRLSTLLSTVIRVLTRGRSHDSRGFQETSEPVQLSEQSRDVSPWYTRPTDYKQEGLCLTPSVLRTQWVLTET